MESLRILIDDESQCRTQRAVLAAFALSLPRADVTWSSRLPPVQGWADAPAASARRLRALLVALGPKAGRCTLYLPGHVVPGDRFAASPGNAGVPVPTSTTIADLDVFLADNGSHAATQFAQHAELNPDYQSCSAFPAAGLATVPPWLSASGMASPGLLTARPWYFVHVPARGQWLAWLRKAIDAGLLTVEDVQADVEEGLVRPSLVADAQAVAAGLGLPAVPDTSLDALFVCPEVRLSDSQYAMLHSASLQARTLRYHRMEAARKSAEAREAPPAQPRLAWPERAKRQVRSLGRRAVKKAYYYYAISLRPLIRGSDPGRSRSQ